jgi:RNA polymerase sigma factor (sigma-70 family)
MPANGLNKVIEHLRSIALRQEAAGMSDSQLLEGFVTARDQVAFAVLVRRYAPLVWNVCRRVLTNHQDAEDAFQATFLVLVRKAASIAKRELLANWLYGVAHRTALKARTALSRRAARERQVPQMPEAEAVQDDVWSSLLPFLDQELSRLPEKYRTAIVLCDLQGKTRKDAARQLRVPEGTVASWLTRGRALLAKRLACHGLAVSGGSLAGVVAGNAQAACVPAGVVWKTIKAATLVAAGQAAGAGVISAKVAGLTEGVVRAMLINKLKLAMGVVVAAVSVTALGGGLFKYGLAAGEGSDLVEAAVLPTANAAQPTKKDKNSGPQSSPVQQDKTVEGDQKQSSRQALLNILDKQIDTEPFQQSGLMSLREALANLVDRVHNAYKIEIPILVDIEAFKAENPDAPDFYEAKVQFPPIPRRMTVAGALRFILSKVETKNATYVVLLDQLRITTEASTSPERMLNEKVRGVFEKRPLTSVLRDLSEAAGVTIIVDPRAGDRAKAEISATLANDTDLAGALRVLSEMADLKVLVLDGTFYVTTRDHAEDLRNEKRAQLAAQRDMRTNVDPLWPYQPKNRGAPEADAVEPAGLPGFPRNELRNSPERRLQEKIRETIEKQQLNGVLRRLSDRYGITIILDTRLGDKAKTEVSAAFHDDVSLWGALRILTEMASLKAVLVDGVVFVTTPTHADLFEKK